MELFRAVGYNELQDCPAAVMIDGNGLPTFLVNRNSFPRMSDFEQRFALAHELGHYLMDSGDEEVADAFALGALAGTEPRSLKKSLSALYNLQTIPYDRMKALYMRCLQLDKNQKNNSKNIKKMKQNLSKIYGAPLQMNREDGEPMPSTLDVPTAAQNAADAAQVIGDIIVGNNRRRAGLRINNVFFSVESILLTAILIVLVVMVAKR